MPAQARVGFPQAGPGLCQIRWRGLFAKDGGRFGEIRCGFRESGIAGPDIPLERSRKHGPDPSRIVVGMRSGNQQEDSGRQSRGTSHPRPSGNVIKPSPSRNRQTRYGRCPHRLAMRSPPAGCRLVHGGERPYDHPQLSSNRHHHAAASLIQRYCSGHDRAGSDAIFPYCGWKPAVWKIGTDAKNHRDARRQSGFEGNSPGDTQMSQDNPDPEDLRRDIELQTHQKPGSSPNKPERPSPFS